MKGMFADTLLPLLRQRSGITDSVVLSRVIRTTGISESLLADTLAPVSGNLEGLSLAYLPGWPGVDLRLTSRDRDDSEAALRLNAAEAAIRGVAGEFVYGRESDDLADVVLGLCREKGFTIAVAESCTGGMLGSRITAIPGSSQLFLGGVIAYSNEVKATHLGVGDDTLIKHGAVSEETALEMAIGVRARYRADVAMSLTGVAGPGGGTTEKPVGLVCLAVDIQGAVRTGKRNMVGDREEIRQRSAQWALDQLRRGLRA
jgi:nicotinamide-nucleotide amidase